MNSTRDWAVICLYFVSIMAKHDFLNKVRKTYLFNDFWGTGENQVIDTFCISTLHIKQGIVNRISSEIEKRCPVYLPFCKPIGLVKDPYNNKDYSTVEGIVTSC